MMTTLVSLMSMWATGRGIRSWTCYDHERGVTMRTRVNISQAGIKFWHVPDAAVGMGTFHEETFLMCHCRYYRRV